MENAVPPKEKRISRLMNGRDPIITKIEEYAKNAKNNSKKISVKITHGNVVHAIEFLPVQTTPTNKQIKARRKNARLARECNNVPSQKYPLKHLMD